MREQIKYTISSDIKNEYMDFVSENYGIKRGVGGTILENALKLQLVVNGHSKYRDDPDVLELLDRVGGLLDAHTHKVLKNYNKEPNDDRIQRLEDKIDQLQVQLVQAIGRTNNNTNESDEEDLQKDVIKDQKRYRENRMDQFVSCFLEEYGEYNQVSTNEIQKLVMDIHGVTDPRSIQSRIDYLKASGHIETYAPNIYTLKS